MKKKILAGSIFLLTIMRVFCASPELAAAALEYIDRLNTFFPREEGSANEKKVFALLEEELTASGIPFEGFRFDNSLNDHSFSSALIVKLPGKREDTLMLTIPVGHPPGARQAEAGSVNLALGLVLLRELHGRELPLSLQVNFMGAEFGEAGTYPLGSRLYLENFFPDYPVMQLYLNFDSVPERIYIQCGGKGIVSPYWLITRTTAALQQEELDFLVKGNENQLFRFGLSTGFPLLAPFLEQGFPALSFTGTRGESPPELKESWFLRSLAFFENFLQQFETGIPQEWDRHYLLFQARSFFLIINEKLYLIIVTAIISFSIIYILVFTRMFKGIIKIFFRHFWQLVAIFLLLFVLVLLSSLILQGISLLRGNPELWQSAPLLFLLLKVLLMFFFFILLRKFYSFKTFTNNRIFYSTGGLIILLLNTLAVAIIDISFTYYFLWAFLFFLLSNIMQHRLVKYLFFLPSAYWMIKTTIEFFLIPQQEFCASLLLSDIPLSLFIALILLPFILHSIAILKKWQLTLGKFLHTVLLLFLFLAVMGLNIYLLIFPPFSRDHRQQVTARHIIDLDTAANTLELSSGSRLGDLTLWIGEEQYFINTGAKKYSIPLKSLPDLFTLQDEQQSFLDRKNIALSLVAREPPREVSLVISAEGEFTLFDANFPFIRRQKGTEYEILIGTNPPSPLRVELTLPADQSYRVLLQIEYRQFPFRFELSGTDKEFDSRLILKKELQLET